MFYVAHSNNSGVQSRYFQDEKKQNYNRNQQECIKKLKKRREKQRPKETNKMEHKGETLNFSGIR